MMEGYTELNMLSLEVTKVLQIDKIPRNCQNTQMFLDRVIGYQFYLIRNKRFFHDN